MFKRATHRSQSSKKSLQQTQKDALITSATPQQYAEQSQQRHLQLRAISLALTMEKYLSQVSREEQVVLCVGCKSAMELDTVERLCAVKTAGLDLCSNDKRIVVGTMERMEFSDDSFDGLYSCHSLHHARDIAATLAEFVRVTKPGGLITIEVPTQFSEEGTTFEKKDGRKKTDPQSCKHMLQHVQPWIDEVLVQEDIVHEKKSCLISRMIVRVR